MTIDNNMYSFRDNVAHKEYRKLYKAGMTDLTAKLDKKTSDSNSHNFVYRWELVRQRFLPDDLRQRIGTNVAQHV